MQFPRGTDLKAALVVGRLLESDGLDFETQMTYSQRHPDSRNLSFEGRADVYSAELTCWWSLEIDARSWGIKEMVPHVTRVKLHGYLETEIDERLTEGDEFEYDSAEKAPAGGAGANPDAPTDVDAPTSANAVRLATQWKLEWEIDKYADVDKNPTSFIPKAEVDVARRHIKILF